MSRNEENQNHRPRITGRRSSIRMSVDTFLIQNNLLRSNNNSICITPTTDFISRLAEAARAFFVALLTMAILILPGEAIFPSPWLGSVLGMRTLKLTLGDTILTTKGVFIPMIPIAGIGYVVALLLNLLSTRWYSILQPFIVTLGTLIIMLCPWPCLKSKNLMLVIFFLMISSPLSIRSIRRADQSMSEQDEELPKWFLASFLATITIGLCVSVGVHLFLLLTPRSTSATRLSMRVMKQLSYTTYKLLHSLSLYTNSLGKDECSVMRARGLIEFYISSRKYQIQTLDGHLASIQAESGITGALRCLNNDSQIFLGVDKVEDFVQCAKRQQQHADIIHLASTNLLLGEEYTHINESVRDLKSMISDNLGDAVEHLALEFQQTENAYFFSSNNSTEALQASLAEYLLAMKKTFHDADKLTSVDELEIDSSARSLIGPKIRFRVIQASVFGLVYELIDLVHEQDEGTQPPESSKPTFVAVKTTLTMAWLHKNPLKLRFALKTALGMLLGSLWVSIPYLREEIAYPNSMWVGITIAIVSLENTGSTVIKCLDRLWGTLIAGAYALLLAKLFPIDIVSVSIAMYSVFAFIAILLKNPARAYANECAVTSLASILFGSFYNELEVHEYVTQRILLIFIGVATFLFVELAIFTRSSRSVVEACAVKWFDDLQAFLLDAADVCRSVPTFQCNDCEVPDAFKDEPLFMLRQGHKDMASHTISLADKLSLIKDTIAIANDELQPAIDEPSLGLHTKLHGIGYEKLLYEQERCISQLEVLITCINSLIGYYSILKENATIRDLQRPHLIAEIISRVSQQLQSCIYGMKVAFPRGLCQPGPCTVPNIIASLSCFRNFEAVRVSILTKSVANSHADYYKVLISSVEAFHSIGFRTTVALAASSVLTIAQCLQFCGLHLEEIARSFPLEDRDFEEESYHQ